MIAAIIQARMGSSRLPGKVLIDIQGKPVLEHVIERVRKSRLVDDIIIATTDNEQDKAIIAFARRRGIPYYAGSEHDVLDRFYQAAREFYADVIVRITADCPLIDPQLIDKVVRSYLENKEKLDYVSNTINPTYPDGLDVEVFSFKSLQRAWKEAKKPSEREHVTPYIWNHPELFRLANIENDKDLSDLRWTLDYEEDLCLVREIYARLYQGQVFLMNDILALLSVEPQLARINNGIVRNEGYSKSLKEDKLIK